MQFQVSSIPAIAFIKDGENPEMTVGALQYEQLKSIIDKKI
jgi:thioredoxin-like negative regulator of GroEL